MGVEHAEFLISRKVGVQRNWGRCLKGTVSIILSDQDVIVQLTTIPLKPLSDS